MKKKTMFCLNMFLQQFLLYRGLFFRGDQCPREANNSWFVPTQFFVGRKFYFVDEILNKYMYIRSLESKSVGKGYRRMPRKLVPHERC